MDETTRNYFLDLDEQELQLKQQYRETERQLEIVQKKRSQLLNELAEKEAKQNRFRENRGSLFFILLSLL